MMTENRSVEEKLKLYLRKRAIQSENFSLQVSIEAERMRTSCHVNYLRH